jgi:SAM-dependent methyltransferase
MAIAQILEASNAFSKKNPAAYSCNLCNSPLKTRFDHIRDHVTNESFAIMTCTKCGLGHTTPMPADLSKYYYNYYGNRHGITSKMCRRRSLGFIERMKNKSTGGNRLLDVGCGDGSFLLAARDAGWKVVGTEIYPEPARFFGLDVRPSLHHIDDDERFDCITMWHSLEHMKNIKETLRLIEGILVPGGHLIIAVPDNKSVQAKIFGPRWLHLDVPRHLYHFDPISLHFGLKNAGFRVFDTRRNELEYDLIGWSQSAMNSLNGTPNIFLDILMGKRKDHSAWLTAKNLALGVSLTLVSLAVLSAGGMKGLSGTFVTFAHKD